MFKLVNGMPRLRCQSPQDILDLGLVSQECPTMRPLPITPDICRDGLPDIYLFWHDGSLDKFTIPAIGRFVNDCFYVDGKEVSEPAGWFPISGNVQFDASFSVTDQALLH
jgi:hypothetical protein